MCVIYCNTSRIIWKKSMDSLMHKTAESNALDLIYWNRRVPFRRVGTSLFRNWHLSVPQLDLPQLTVT